MTYELAKELKDAGFPQYGNNREVDGSLLMVSPTFGVIYDVDVYVPTLEELIEACVKLSPDGDFHLEHIMSGDEKEWGAATCWNPVATEEWYCGPDPETACIRLWLALQKV